MFSFPNILGTIMLFKFAASANINKVKNPILRKTIIPVLKMKTPTGQSPSIMAVNNENVSNSAATVILSSSRSKKNSIKVVMDIDDTVKSSGGKTFLGIPLGGIGMKSL